ncbi:hypothetical protein O181_133701 [Austropuccinia psidii MF-1]|uniref:Uncharacterized protein n=1 Tax=Austropuccinia psidii MF-1 TaxID=1389203 RepID=A0A9Q3L7V6_9BASI|nr:hypothetical protein [Austropuccinia psidii MF-1]
MEAAIQSNQRDVDNEDARPNPEVSHLPQERHIWRMPEFPPIPQDQKKELETTPDLETEVPVASTSSKPTPEVSKDKPKGPQKKQRRPKNHQDKAN